MPSRGCRKKLTGQSFISDKSPRSQWTIPIIGILALLANGTSSERFESYRTDTNVSMIRFYLYTRQNPGLQEYDELYVDDAESILNSHFDVAKKTKIVAHGFSSGPFTSGAAIALREAYLEKEDCNVISVDWESLAAGPNFVRAARNAIPSGSRVAEFLQSLMDVTGAPLEDFHAVGSSLGGQMMAGLGQGMEGRMKRITALDPAGPMFHLAPPEERLDPDDAELVDVIHTAGRWVGMDGIVGDIDFYPNGGIASMPGCEGEPIDIQCSHARKEKYMAESITSDVGFVAWECGSMEDFEAGLCDDATTNLMGEPVDPSKRGTFYLRTNSEPPYAIPAVTNFDFGIETNVSYIRFYLWTRQNPGTEDFDELFVDDVGSILESHFDASKKTKILAHGAGGKGLDLGELRNAYLAKEDCNVISVDWELLVKAPFYVKAARNAMPAGARVAELVQSLMDTTGASLEDFHGIGSSLGGQLMGGLGHAMEGKMSRITALDPAGPMFHTVPPEERLDAGDAELVDVIHTAGRWIGMDGVVGDIDFYPNGGIAYQAGCEKETVGLECSHGRKEPLMAETITSEVGFIAWECGSMEEFEAGLCDDSTTNFMGEPVDPSKRGTFYLNTNSEPPFAIPPSLT